MGRKPRLLSCCVQWPHRRHESLPSTQNSFIRNEGELLLLLKPLDASLSPAWPCVIVTLPKPSGPRFCALALAVRAKDRMRSRLRVFTVCLCASLFVPRTDSLDVLPATPANKQAALLSLDCANCKKPPNPPRLPPSCVLTLCLPLCDVSTQRTTPEPGPTLSEPP